MLLVENSYQTFTSASSQNDFLAYQTVNIYIHPRLVHRTTNNYLAISAHWNSRIGHTNM